jgi:hypothetical protein
MKQQQKTQKPGNTLSIEDSSCHYQESTVATESLRKRKTTNSDLIQGTIKRTCKPAKQRNTTVAKDKAQASLPVPLQKSQKQGKRKLAQIERVGDTSKKPRLSKKLGTGEKVRDVRDKGSRQPLVEMNSNVQQQAQNKRLIKHPERYEG